MRFVAVALLACVITGLAAPSARAEVSVEVDISRQRMTVREYGQLFAVWPVSTARAGKVTPTGHFRPYTMRRMHYSSLYDNAPMPYSIFFNGNYAIHGTTAVRRLGNPASAGCVRLAPAHAALLFALVQRHGMAATRIAIHRRATTDGMIAARPARLAATPVAAAAPIRVVESAGSGLDLRGSLP